MSEQPKGCDHCREVSFEHLYRPAVNEDGWECGHCGAHLGYRPDLDKALIENKVTGLLMDLCDAKFLHVSNGSEAEGVIGQVEAQCRSRGRYDQYTILHLLVEACGRERHAVYWAGQAAQWVPPWEQPAPSAADEMRAVGAAALPGFERVVE